MSTTLSASRSSFQDAIAPWTSRLALLVWAVFTVAILFGHIHRPEDFQYYVTRGQAVLDGTDIYDAPIDQTPPLFALLCAPLAYLNGISPYLAILLWSALNAAALFWFLDLAARVAYGRGLALKAGSGGISLADAAIFLPVVMTLPYIDDNFEMHQVNPIIFALALAGLVWMQRGKLARGGIALGLATSLKIMPVLFLPYLAWRRQWRAAFVASVATAGLSMSPMLIFGWRRFWSDAFLWFRIVQGAWHAGSGNQSLLAMWDRIIGHHVIPFVAPSVPISLPWSGDPWVRVAWAATVVVMGLAMLAAFRWKLCASLRCWGLEWSAVFLAGAIIGPVTWRHYFLVMILPNMLLYALWRSREESAAVRRVSGVLFLVCGALAMSTEVALVHRAIVNRVVAASITTDAALIMLAGVLWLRRAVADLPSSVVGRSDELEWNARPAFSNHASRS